MMSVPRKSAAFCTSSMVQTISPRSFLDIDAGAMPIALARSFFFRCLAESIISTFLATLYCTFGLVPGLIVDVVISK